MYYCMYIFKIVLQVVVNDSCFPTDLKVGPTDTTLVGNWKTRRCPNLTSANSARVMLFASAFHYSDLTNQKLNQENNVSVGTIVCNGLG